jgi:hypothetical protein
MRAGHSSLTASLSRFDIVSATESEYRDGLGNEEHIIWDCKLYEDQRATMMDILSENRALQARGKRFVQGVCYFINKIPTLIEKEKEVYVQNSNSIF